MALNEKQISLHWREFAAAKSASLAAGHPEPDRKALYIQAGVVVGTTSTSSNPVAKSLTKFNNGDLDKVLAVFRALSQPANLDAQVEATEQPRVRLEYSIRELASQITDRPVHVADNYWRAVASDKFGLRYPANSAVRVEFSELSDLSIPQLEQLRNTLENRLASKKKKALQTMECGGSATPLCPALEPDNDNVPF